MNNDSKPIDRETRIMLLQALKRGYFLDNDFKLLSDKAGFTHDIKIEIIDKTEDVIHKDYED